MNTKEIVIILIISILTILLAGVVIASDLGNSGGADPERGIEIESIEFNIPTGYEKNDSKTVVNQSNSTGDYGFDYNQQTFENSKGEEIVITIVDYKDFDVNTQTLYKICEGTDEKTLMGYPGYINKQENFTQFAYAYDKKAVSITAPNEDLINQILVVEDA